MNHLGDVHLRTWTLRFMALLAAETQGQLVWLGERELETKDVVEEVELLCRVSEGSSRSAESSSPRICALFGPSAAASARSMQPAASASGTTP
ncbi:hypothetical protein [Streptomyces sp. NBC_01294]|uniref:hypothetical protein n=1 Tax=Streptomyces sp. NBC_01294 TaxID=2903815 RepID=UPI002DDA7775|nr:hypothetical protein [Streptomyces sp. NBC_01294]WRZ55129.1 hypothetical protein OG534_00480 [Streptomyces sp. NBC_01294]